MSLVVTENISSIDEVLTEDEIVIAADRGWCKADKHVLAEKCQFFQLLFSSQHALMWKENKERKVSFDWLSIEVLVFLIKFINQPDFDIDPKLKISQVIQAAEFFNIESLRTKACDFYQDNVLQGFTRPTRDKVAQVISVLKDSDYFMLIPLKTRCVFWIGRNFSDIWYRAEYTKLPPSLKEETYQATLKRVTKLDGRVLIYIQEINKLKSIVSSNTKSEAFLMANRLENDMNNFVLKNFKKFIEILIQTDVKITRIPSLYDNVANLLKFVGTNFTVNNICEIYLANHRMCLYGMRMQWSKETVMLRFCVFGDKCESYCWRMLQIIQRDDPIGWGSLPLELKEQFHSTRKFKQQSTVDSSGGGFFFIGFDDKPTTKPPASFLRHTERQARTQRERTVSSSPVTVRRTQMKKATSTNRDDKVVSKPINSQRIVRNNNNNNNNNHKLTCDDPAHPPSDKTRTAVQKTLSFPAPPSQAHSRIPVLSRVITLPPASADITDNQRN